jgi:Putative prokaryotic signal transducing protein
LDVGCSANLSQSRVVINPPPGNGSRRVAFADVEAGEPVVLTVVSGEPEAEVVCGLLRSAGIECGYRDTEAIDSPLEDFIAAGAREILVRESDLEAAKELLAAPEV